MTNLRCDVDSCLYNKAECCCKGDIMVEGSGAQRTEDTCCGSFRERGGDSYMDSVKSAKKDIDVSCDVVNCCYNENCKCAADHIGIAGKSACDCAETECATFCSK